MNIVILAAGAGKRMRSKLPKVLHTLGGKALLAHVLETAKQLNPTKIIIVVGHGAQQIQQTITDPNITFAHQAQQLGTGHAVQQAVPFLNPDQPTLILYGDVPLIQKESLLRFIEQTQAHEFGLLTAHLQQPSGYGRILRDSAHNVQRIIEDKDATLAQRAIQEINTGIMLIPSQVLTASLAQLTHHNAQNEYYLTDLVDYALAQGIKIITNTPAFTWEIFGANNKQQLAALETALQQHLADQLLTQGVHLFDPQRLAIRGQLTCGEDVSIDFNCLFEGQVTLEDDVHIGAHCIIRNTHIAQGTCILPFSYVDGARIGAQSVIGPYARIRPETQLANETHIGNFVEIKNSAIGTSSKINHLSYIGDAQIGQHVNVGAGTITCNYDGANKHPTTIDDHVFIGSNSALVAPVHVQSNATIAASTTVWKDVSADALVLNEKNQTEKANYQRPKKSAATHDLKKR